ncbi:(R,R)-butanediol dehydrogenase [Lecanosticta acicola]|uniref:(R,R)-butanediol dehydrogenase n=1 Tax=Lecanosticta acicola TaxID=111012 RepID=A0AAI8Z0Q8_9PEZI|nr:(R,R)-butanediol dehydrogenase [Lecanosticta acicola]
MQAARYHGKQDIRIQDDVPVPPCGEGQVLVAPAFVGICGTDLHECIFSPTTPHPVTNEKIPITIGHEFSGTITSLGRNLTRTDLHIGQHVAIQPTVACGACGACQTSAENACPKGGFVGLSGGGGGMAEYVALPEAAIFPLPSNVGLAVGALVEPLAVAWHAVDASPMASLGRNAKCLVLGGGPIGLAVVQVLLGRGAQKVICAEVATKRQEFARVFGAHHVLDPTDCDLPQACLDLCGGVHGPDIVFDCAGVPQSLEAACKAVRARGAVVNVAIWETAVPFNPNWLVFREASYQATLGYQAKDFQGVVDALGAGKMKPEGMITSTIRMDQLVDRGYLALINEKDKHVKILVDVQGSLRAGV